ncbi:MAG: Gfo/Idh/MocA family protein [Chloroflexota bacterium]
MAKPSGDGRIRVGIIGSGAISQIIHLPILRQLREQFEIAALCDISAETMSILGVEYGVPAHAQFTDYRALCASDLVDAVLICPLGTHVPYAIEALKHGKHVLVEKPLTSRVDEADAFVAASHEAREKHGAVTLMAYMKRHDAGYQYAQRLVRPLADKGEIRFVEAHHIHSRNERYMDYFPVIRPTDIPDSARAAARAEHESVLAAALGPNPDGQVAKCFGGMMGSSIHDVYTLSGLLGRPKSIIASEVWDDGHCWRAMFEFPNGTKVNYAWIDIRDVRRFQQEFACYGPDIRVSLTLAMPFIAGDASTVRVQQMEPSPADPAPYGRHDGTAHAGDTGPGLVLPGGEGWPAAGTAHTEKFVTPGFDNQFKREWQHFHACITRGVEPLVGAQEARDDTAFIIEWARATRGV